MTYGGAKRYPPGWKKPTELTLDEWTPMQADNRRPNGSSATGKYQFMPRLLKDVRGAMDLQGSEAGTQELQDRMGREALRIAGYDKYLAGEIDRDKFQKGLARYWASVPDPKTDKSRHNQRLGVTSERIQAVIDSAKAEADHLRDLGLDPGGHRWR